MQLNILTSTSEEGGLKLDPRTKLYLLIVFSIIMIDGKTGGVSMVLKPMLALVPFILLIFSGRRKSAMLYLTVFAVSWMVNIWLVPMMSGAFIVMVSLVVQLGTRWFPSAMMGYYLLSTTKVSEFVLAMQKMRVPEMLIIPFSVMFRFFPTVFEEASAIGNAMRMRGIGGRNFLKKPSAMLEYRMVPLMMSVVTIGNDLSAAALTRGLGSDRKRTSICRIGFRGIDILFMFLGIGSLIVFFGF